jgi:hypothetical protein
MGAAHRGADRALARRSMQGFLHHRSDAARSRWKGIRSFIMNSAFRSCALAAASSSALGISRRKITLISTSIRAIPARSSAPTALRCSVSIRAWAHTKLIRQIVRTLTQTELKSANALLASCWPQTAAPGASERRARQQYRARHHLNHSRQRQHSPTPQPPPPPGQPPNSSACGA